MANKVSSSVAHSRLLVLHTFGLLKDVSARGKLSETQQKRVRETTRKYHEVLTAPKGEYVKQDLKDNYSAGQKKSLQDAGVKIIGNTAYIPNQGYSKSRITKEATYIDGKTVIITGIERERKRGSGSKKSFEIVESPLKKAEWASRLMDEYNALGMEEDQFFYVKAYNNRPIARAFTSVEGLFAYESQMNLSDDTNRNELRNNLHLVRLTVKEMADLDITEKTPKERRAYTSARRKNAKKLTAKKKPSPRKSQGR